MSGVVNKTTIGIFEPPQTVNNTGSAQSVERLDPSESPQDKDTPKETLKDTPTNTPKDTPTDDPVILGRKKRSLSSGGFGTSSVFGDANDFGLGGNHLSGNTFGGNTFGGNTFGGNTFGGNTFPGNTFEDNTFRGKTFTSGNNGGYAGGFGLNSFGGESCKCNLVINMLSYYSFFY